MEEIRPRQRLAPRCLSGLAARVSSHGCNPHGGGFTRLTTIVEALVACARMEKLLHGYRNSQQAGGVIAST
jgi:hypothetical protein